jgi:predicted Rossmann-fold nucleotide-binding protein
MASSNSSSISITLDDMDPSILKSDFVSQVAPQSLRITCYGSSSAKTPENYLQAARSLGYTLAKRGHVCINGAGPAGCMSAMNDGAVLGSGHIIGVIHEMFLVDNGYLEDGKQVNFDDVGTHKAFQTTNEETGLIREIVVAGGDDLQERKKLLVKTADALVVLPGGPGTWDGMILLSIRPTFSLYQN